MPLQTYADYFGPPQRPDASNLLQGMLAGQSIRSSQQRNLLNQELIKNAQQARDIQAGTYAQSQKQWSEQDKTRIKAEIEAEIDRYLPGIDTSSDESFRKTTEPVIAQVMQGISGKLQGQVPDELAAFFLGIRNDLKSGKDLTWLRKGIEYRKTKMGVVAKAPVKGTPEYLAALQAEEDIKQPGRRELADIRARGKGELTPYQRKRLELEQERLDFEREKGGKPKEGKSPRPYKLTPADKEELEARLEELEAIETRNWVRMGLPYKGRKLTPEEAKEKQDIERVLRRFTEQFTPGTEAPAEEPERTVVRTGTYQGRKVVEYSDGTVEYAD